MCPIISAIIQIIRIRASIVFYLIRTSRFSSYHQLHNISYSNVPTLMDPVQGRLDNHQFGECLDREGMRMDRVQLLETSNGLIFNSSRPQIFDQSRNGGCYQILLPVNMVL